MDQGNQYVLLVSQHRQFGLVAVVWEVEQEKENWLQLAIRVTSEIPIDYQLPVTPDSIVPSDGTRDQYNSVRLIINQLIVLSNTCCDQEIHRRFSRKGTLLKDFLNGLSEEFVGLNIRPLIDRQMDKMFRMIIGRDIPVFMSEGSPRLYPENRIIPERIPVEPWFCFTRKPEGSDYILELFHEEKKLALNAAGNKIICNNPCWFKHGNRLLHFPEGFDGKKIQPFLTKKSILIPLSAEKKYFETFILKTIKTGQVKAEGFTVLLMKPEKRMELSLEFDWQGKAVLIIFFSYGDKRIMAGKEQKTFINLRMEESEVVFYKTERDFSWEASMIERCRRLGLNQINANALGLKDSSDISEIELYSLVEWLTGKSAEIAELGIVVQTNRSPIGYYTGPIHSEIQVIPGEDWFDVKAVVRFGELKIPFVKLRKYILNGIREFPLPGGLVAVLPGEWFTRYGDLFHFSKDQNDWLRLPVKHFRLIADLSAKQDAFLRARLESLDFHHSNAAAVPAGLNATLRPYQAEGLQWLIFLHEHGFGGCLADDMGLGKTIQTLALLLSQKPTPHRATLVIMPASLIHNWKNEIRRFSPSLSVMVHTGMLRATSTEFFNTVDIILTTYGTVRNDAELLAGYTFNYLILDESQIIKNPEAQVTRVVCLLQSDHRLVLTGTPIENSLTDLWSQMQFLNPGLLGSLNSFQKRFKSLQTGAMKASDGKKKADSVSWCSGEKIVVINANEEEIPVDDLAEIASRRLKNIISPFILRRTKSEVEPDLPLLTIKEVFCEMTDDQKNFYEREKSAIRNEILQQFERGGSPETSLAVLKALIRLRQASSHPALLDPEYTGESGKFGEVIQTAFILREEGHKVLLFSSFVKHLQLIARRFNEEGIKYTLLTGATTKREEVIERFRNDENISFFLISLKAGGAGLNLTEADYIMLLDPWWNPAAELQAISRAHRIGQDKKVIAYKFISSETIEEKMIKLQERKQQLSDAFVPSGNPLKDMTREEIRGLF